METTNRPLVSLENPALASFAVVFSVGPILPTVVGRENGTDTENSCKGGYENPIVMLSGPCCSDFG